MLKEKNKKFLSGVVHTIPKDLKIVLEKNSKIGDTWNTLTPLARNEWICWIESAKKEETRVERIRRTKENLGAGKRRPCCWIGCSHR